MAVEDPEPPRSPSPAVSSTWYDSSASCRSLETSNTSAASDPYWRDPVERLKRWKLRVAHGMKLLRDYGQEGKDVIQRQELRARGYLTNIFMRDGRTRPPDDLSFWKARHDFFAKEWRLIQARNHHPEPAQPRVLNPHLEWIRDWIADTQAATAEDVDRPNVSKDFGSEIHPSGPPITTPSPIATPLPIASPSPIATPLPIASPLPIATASGYQTRVANEQARDEGEGDHSAGETDLSEPPITTVAGKARATAKRAHDQANGLDNGGASPAKRSKRNASDATEKSSQVPQPKQVAGKVIVSAPVVAQGRPCRAPRGGGGQAGVQKSAGTPQPLRRSARVLAAAATAAQKHPHHAPQGGRGKAGVQKSTPQPRRQSARGAAVDATKAGHDKTKSFGRRASTTASRAAAAAKARDEKAKLASRPASTTTRRAATTKAKAEKAKPVNQRTSQAPHHAATTTARAKEVKPVSRQTHAIDNPAAAAKARHADKATPVSRPISTTAGRAATAKAKS